MPDQPTSSGPLAGTLTRRDAVIIGMGSMMGAGCLWCGQPQQQRVPAGCGPQRGGRPSIAGDRVFDLTAGLTSTTSPSAYGVLQAAGLIFFARAGYARIATLGEEVQDPQRTIGQAIAIAFVVVVGIYVGVGHLRLSGVVGVRGDRQRYRGDQLWPRVVPVCGFIGAGWLGRRSPGNWVVCRALSEQNVRMKDTGITVRWDHLRPQNLQQWADLNNLLARVDRTEEFFEAEDLAEDLASATFTAELDSWGMWWGDRLIGIGQVLVPELVSNEGLARSYLFGGIHPDYRGRGFGRQLLEAQERRGAELAQQRHPAQLRIWFVDGGVPGASVRPMLVRRGYDIARYFAHMVRLRSAGFLAPNPDLPTGVSLLTPSRRMWHDLRHLHNLSFQDHWGAGAKSEQGWKEERESRAARPPFCSVAVDRDGVPLSYVWAAQWVDRELYIDAVGTAPAARHQGLAEACLSRTVNLAMRSGQYDKVDLGVDSASPTGATRLYEKLGFEVDRTAALFSRPVPVDQPQGRRDVIPDDSGCVGDPAPARLRYDG